MLMISAIGGIMLKFWSLVLIVALSPSWVWARAAGDPIRPLRKDLTIPEDCRDLDIEDFQGRNLETILYGIEGSLAKGFTHAYPIDRGQATQLWNAMKLHIEREDFDPHFRNPELKEAYQILLDNYEAMDFDFHAEGEVLELLAITEIQKQLSDEYFVTGSLSYYGHLNGEVDLVIGRTADCEVEVIGEAKLGVRQANHARQQLRRFRDFIGSFENLALLTIKSSMDKFGVHLTH